jgi:DNA polymerase-3 subunit delta
MSRHLTPEALRQDIERGQLDRVYLLDGDDDVEKLSLATAFAESIEEDLRAFNLDRLYGGESRIRGWTIVDLARTLPMMAPRRVILVLQAEKLLATRKGDEAGAADLEALELYLKAPEAHATVVFVASGELDKRLRIIKLLYDAATVVDCGGIRDIRDAVSWIKAKAAREGVKVQPDAVRLLAERAGTDIGRLRADVERVFLYASEDKLVTADRVDEVVGPATAQDAWAITRAIEERSPATALKELALLLEAGAVPYMVLGQLAWLARTKLPASKVPAAIEAVFRTDLALKSSGGDPRMLLERLVVELCG